MAEIELVIKIPEDIYNEIKEKHGISVENFVKYTAYLEIAVENGTPLPKGHGKLIDVGQCDRKLFYQQCGGADSLITVRSAFDMLMSLPPIIEADKGEE